MSEDLDPFFQIAEVDEIAFAMSLFVSAASFTIPSSPTKKTLLSGGECWRVFRLYTADMHRAATRQERPKGESSLEHAFMALWTHYEGDMRQRSICARVLGFHGLMMMTEGALVADWVFSSEERPEIVLLHPAVVRAVAITPLESTGVMFRKEFVRTLKITAEAETQQAA